MEDESGRVTIDNIQDVDKVDGPHATPESRNYKTPNNTSADNMGYNGKPIKVDSIPTLVIPCHHIRIGDLLVLQNRPCQVIRISTSAATGEYRYLGIDVFTKQLLEDASIISCPTSNVVVQSMLAPVLKQYRVLDLVDGHVSAMTETGDVKLCLPVLEQSNIWSRLELAFNAGRGAIRVLVMSAKENLEIVVDFKVLDAPSLSETRPGQPEFDLHSLARAGDTYKLQEALETKQNTNELDSHGRSPIFYAVENGDVKTTLTLLDAEATLNIIDHSGKTVLDIAVGLAESNPSMSTMAETLLSQGASPMEGINPQVLKLLSASAKGDAIEVAKILRQKALINDTDRLGYTALHEAACFGRYNVAELLIQNKASPSARVALGDDGILHAVVERRGHRRFLNNDRRNPPDVGKDHIRVIELLLRYGQGSLASQRRRQDGKTVQDAIFAKLKSTKLSKTSRYSLQQMLIILRSYSLGKARSDEKQAKPTPTPPNSFQLEVQYCPLNPGEDPNRMNIEKFVNQLSPISSDRAGRWINLPRNNKTWVENVIGAVSGLSGQTLQMYLNGTQAFLDDAYDEIQCPTHHPGMRRASFVPFHEHHDDIFSLVIPYFNADSLECLQSQANSSILCRNDTCKTNRSAEHTLKEFYNKADGPSKSWHEPCTLDQSYYVFLQVDDISRRNEDQVVAKHVRRRTGHGRHEKNILMVNQMWIWTIDSETIITAYPRDRQDHGIDDSSANLSARIAEALQQKPPQSLGSLILLLIQCAIEFVDAPANCGLHEDVLHIFNQSIALLAQSEAILYGKFDAAQQENTHPSNEDTRHNMCKEEEMCDIRAEIKHLREIKDIRDELRMIERVFSDQRLVVNKFRSTKAALLQSEVDHLRSLEEGLDFRRSRVRELLKDAHSVEQSLNYLLDIKQKRGNLNVVRDTRRLADQAEKRALDGEWQTQLLFIFTVITVIFTPISFVCGLLAVPSRDFPENAEGNTAWTWWQVMVSGVVTELVTFATIAAFWIRSPKKNTQAVPGDHTVV